LWEYQLQLTVFTLSFFVNHAYQYWRNVYFCTRAIQGRLNDLCMLVTMGARRSAKYGDINGTIGYQTNLQLHPDDNVVTEKNDSRDSKRLVSDVTRLLRMSHTFFWASTPTHSDGFGDVHHTLGGIVGDDDLELTKDFDPSQFGPTLMSQDGLNMLVRRGQLTENEKQALIATGLPPSQYPFVLLEWAGIRCIDALESGELRGGPGFEDNLLKYFTQCRAEYFSIGDFNSGRMPMAYGKLIVSYLQLQNLHGLTEISSFLYSSIYGSISGLVSYSCSTGLIYEDGYIQHLFNSFDNTVLQRFVGTK